MENLTNRNITLSTKVTAEQKAIFASIAAKNNISLSEWMASLLEIHKDSYDKIGDPTQRETDLEMQLQKKQNQINRLKSQLESADNRVQFEIKRANEAVSKRDEEILKFKKLQIENTNLIINLNNAISQKANGEKKALLLNNENKSLILPTLGLASVLFGLIIGKK